VEMAASNQLRANGKIKRLALLHSDGSIGILPAGCTFEQAEAEARFLNDDELDVSDFTKVALVQLEVLEVPFSPSRLMPAEIARVRPDLCRRRPYRSHHPGSHSRPRTRAAKDQ
jgi:hypothetical protein